MDQNDGNGPQPLNGLGFLMYRLRQRYGSQDIETQLKSVLEMMSFERMPGEPMDNAITRFDILAYRSTGQAGFDLSIPGKTFWLLTRCKVPNSSMDEHLYASTNKQQFLSDNRGRVHSSQINIAYEFSYA